MQSVELFEFAYKLVGEFNLLSEEHLLPKNVTTSISYSEICQNCDLSLGVNWDQFYEDGPFDCYVSIDIKPTCDLTLSEIKARLLKTFVNSLVKVFDLMFPGHVFNYGMQVQAKIQEIVSAGTERVSTRNYKNVLREIMSEVQSFVISENIGS